MTGLTGAASKLGRAAVVRSHLKRGTAVRNEGGQAPRGSEVQKGRIKLLERYQSANSSTHHQHAIAFFTRPFFYDTGMHVAWRKIKALLSALGTTLRCFWR